MDKSIARYEEILASNATPPRAHGIRWKVEFEQFSDIHIVRERAHHFLEIKPTMGDDFPSVLRQMKAQRDRAYSSEYGFRYRDCSQWTLILGEYTGTGATIEQLRKVFAASGFSVVLAREIEAVKE